MSDKPNKNNQIDGSTELTMSSTELSRMFNPEQSRRTRPEQSRRTRPEQSRRIDLSISIVSFNTKSLLEQCLYSIYKNNKNLKFEVFVVDNGSKDGTPEMVRQKFPKIKLIANKKNFLFTKAHNQALRKITRKYFLVLNADTIIGQKVFEEMIKFMENHPNVGLASCREIDEGGKVDLTCSRFPHPILEFFESSFSGKFLRTLAKISKVEKMLATYRYANWKRDTIRAVDVIPGSFFMGRKEVLEKVGLFDENLLLFYEEPDYCWRVKLAGWEIFHNGKVQITHLRAKALAKLPQLIRYQISEHDMLTFYKKYFGFGWWLFLWLSFRPNWLYWKTKALISR